MPPGPRVYTLFPYTALFRSASRQGSQSGPHRTLVPPLSRCGRIGLAGTRGRSEEHTSELQSLRHLVCRLGHEYIPSFPTRRSSDLHLDKAARADRIERWFHPYHDAVESVLLEREARGVQSIAVSIHSMTASLAGKPRPWQIALSSHLDRRLTDPVLAALCLPGDVVVGDNQPYDLDPEVDYSTPVHAMRRRLPHIQVEFRQDEIPDATTQHRWALRLAKALM